MVTVENLEDIGRHRLLLKSLSSGILLATVRSCVPMVVFSPLVFGAQIVCVLL